MAIKGGVLEVVHPLTFLIVVQVFMTAARSKLKRVVTAINGNAFVRAVKNLRNEAVDSAFQVSGGRERDRFLHDFQPKHDVVVFAIAFNTPWVVDLLTAAWNKYVSDASLVVVDNSGKTGARAEHRLICEERGMHYCSLPQNFEWNPNRSHAISMNWIYYNLVCRIRPRVFGFVDHDCFPIKPVSIASLMGENPVYGVRRESMIFQYQWYMWPGFCFYDFSRVADSGLDFKHGYEAGTDTGGNNWLPLYSKLQANNSAFADLRTEETIAAGSAIHEQIIGGVFNHIGGAAYRPAILDVDKRRSLADILWSKYIGPQQHRIVKL